MNKRKKLFLGLGLGIAACIILLSVGFFLFFGGKSFDRSGWHTGEDGTILYLEPDGTPQTGWQSIDEKLYYFHPEDGSLATGWISVDGKHYYLNAQGTPVTGWLTEDTGNYYLDHTGAAVTGWWQEGVRRYYFGANGKQATLWQTIEEKRYYFGTDGVLDTGWQEIDGNRYYFSGSGILQTGWANIRQNRYYFDKDGIYATGWQEIDGAHYYFDDAGVLQTGWLDWQQKRYYLDSNVSPVTGWQEIDETLYYFHEDATMAVGKVVLEDITHFFSSTGAYTLLTNRDHPIPEGYTPNLVDIHGYLIDESCRDALAQMLADCNEAGYYCVINNTYRTQELQQYLWNRRVRAYMSEGYDYYRAVQLAGRSVAVPGTSEHQLGLAVDIIGSNDMYRWLEAHCTEYGFILRYPDGKTEYTGIKYEPWHFRYLGKQLAEEITSLGLCMEEYMDMLTEKAGQ